MYQKAVFIFLIIIIYSEAYSQDNKAVNSFSNRESKNYLFGYNHWGFIFVPYVTEKANIKKTSGDYILRSSNQLGGELGVSYSLNINAKNSLTTGFKIGTLENNYLFTVKKDDYIPPALFDYDVSFPGDLNLKYFSVPLSYNYRIFFNNDNHFLELSAGINIRVNFNDETFLSSQVGYDRIVELELISKSKIWLNYSAGISHSWILKNLNIIKAGLLFNYSNTSIGGGDYSITIPGREAAFGTYNVKGSYAGIEIGYILTRTKRRKI